jgi:hypothetical protein
MRLLQALAQLQMCSTVSMRLPPLSQHGELVKAALPGAPTIKCLHHHALSAYTTKPSGVQTQLKRALHARRVLSFSEADAQAVLDAAMPVCCPSSTVDALRSQVARGLPAAQMQVSMGACEATQWWAGWPEVGSQSVDVGMLHRVARDLPATSSVSHLSPMQAELVRLVCHWGAARPLAITAVSLGAAQQSTPCFHGGCRAACCVLPQTLCQVLLLGSQTDLFRVTLQLVPLQACVLYLQSHC